MSQVINTNIMSLNAQRNLANSSASLSTTIQRLSSGLRINSAKDDAAGLAISERFTTQIRGMNQAARNANDGISLSQTAEGALGEIGNNLQRIRELAVQSRNATNSASDRQALNAEVQLLKAEIQRVAEQTNFNGTSLLDGTFQNQAFQIGADQGQVINIAQIANANIESLGNWTKAPTAAGMNAAAALGNGGSSGTATVAGTAASLVGSGAVPAGPTVSSASGAFTAAESSAAGETFTFSVGGVTILSTTSTAANEFVSGGAINTALTDATVLANLATAGITFTGSIGGGNNNLTFTKTDGSSLDIAVTSNYGNEAGSFATAGYAGTHTTTTPAQPGTFNAIAAGALSLNGEPITVAAAADAATRLTNLETAINGGTGTHGVTASIVSGALTLTSSSGAPIEIVSTMNAAALAEQTGLVAGSTPAGGAIAGTYPAGNFVLTGPSGAATINFAEAGGATQRASNLVTAINNQSYNTGVTASLVNGNLVLNADQGDFTVGNGLTATATAAEITAADAALLGATGLTAGTTEADAVGSAWVAGVPATGFADLDISTADAADNALLAMDAALTEINSARADLGAIQNRFQSTIASLNTASENLSAARSRIRDTDFAKETAELTRTQILQQAGTAMLAQANQVPQNVLSLLK